MPSGTPVLTSDHSPNDLKRGTHMSINVLLTLVEQYKEAAQLIEAAQAMGCTNLQIIWHVLLPEAKPSLISGCVISTVTILSYTALAATLGGTGLGLAISKQIIEEHNGRIELTSRENKGTKVKIILPLSPAVTRGIPNIE